MTIEQTLTSIADSLKLIADHLTKAPNHATAPLPVVPAPVAVAAPAPVEVPAPVAPAPAPVFQPAPAPAPVPPVATAPCPITNQGQLVAYVMESYKTLGPVKGNMIQGVLAGTGNVNINGVSPEHFPAIYAGIEALKAQA